MPPIPASCLSSECSTSSCRREGETRRGRCSGGKGCRSGHDSSRRRHVRGVRGCRGQPDGTVRGARTDLNYWKSGLPMSRGNNKIHRPRRSCRENRTGALQMKSLFDASSTAEVKERVMRLTADNKAASVILMRCEAKKWRGLNGASRPKYRIQTSRLSPLSQ